MGDDLARQRRELPWVRVDEQYTLETESGPKTYRERMGWSFTWVSSCESGFHFDYGVSATAQTAQGSVALFLRGTRVSTFTRLDDAIYHCTPATPAARNF